VQWDERSEDHWGSSKAFGDLVIACDFERTFDRKSRVESWSFGFTSRREKEETVIGGHLPTGDARGKNMMILGFVVASLRDFLDREEPTRVVFTANKRNKLAPLYRAMSAYLRPQVESLGYTVQEVSEGNFEINLLRYEAGQTIGRRESYNPTKRMLGESATDVVRLYHGTNDILATEIARWGFQAVGGSDTFQVLKDLAGRVVPGALPRDVLVALQRHAKGYRTPSIFFTPNPEIAASHAQGTFHTGGEIGEEVAAILKDVIGLETPLFSGAKPVVIAVDLPRDWIGPTDSAKYEVVLQRDHVPADFIVGIKPV
jgi:hypothetical protein